MQARLQHDHGRITRVPAEALQPVPLLEGRRSDTEPDRVPGSLVERLIRRLDVIRREANQRGRTGRAERETRARGPRMAPPNPHAHPGTAALQTCPKHLTDRPGTHDETPG